MLSRTKKAIMLGVDSMRIGFERSPVAQTVYYRTKAFVRSTFIYDLCVSEGHVVVRGLLDFIILGPGKLVRAVGRGFVVVVEFVLLFIRVLRGAVWPSVIAVFLVRIVPSFMRALLVLLVFIGVDTVSAGLIASILYTRAYSQTNSSVYTIKESGFRSSVYSTACRTVSRSAALALGSIRPSGLRDWLVLIFVSPLYAVVLAVLLPSFFIFGQLFKYAGYVFLAVVCAPAIYATVVAISAVSSATAFLGGFHCGRILIGWFSSAVSCVRVFAGRTVLFCWWLSGFSCTLVLRPGSIHRSLRWCSAPQLIGYGFIVSVGLYYAAVVEWMHYFDQYLCLEQLSFFAHNRGWDWGSRKWRRITEYVQYEQGFYFVNSNWWSGLNILMARMPYFFSAVDGWYTTLTCHPEFLYLVVLVVAVVLYVVDHGRIFETKAVTLLRCISVIIFVFRLVALIPEGANVICGDTLFVQMYVTGGWWEVLASCVISGILVVGLGAAMPYRNTGVFYIFLGTVAVLAYASVSMPFCNDFVSIFLTSELFSVGGLGLFVIGADRAANSAIFKYAVFNVVGGILLLYGCLVIYGVTSLSDLSRMLGAAQYSGAQFEVGFVVFVLGLLFKLCSAPVLVVLERIYTKLCVNLLVVVVVASEMAYAGLLFRTLMVGLIGAKISAVDQPALMSVLLFAAAAAGFASTRTSSFIAGTLYSSVQHISFMLSILVVSYNWWFGTTLSVVYYVFYALTAFFFILLFGFVGSRGLDTSGAARGIVRFTICALALSLAGIPPFMGFYLKLFLFTVLTSHSLWFAVALSTLSSIYAFVFYGRVLWRNLPDLSKTQAHLDRIWTTYPLFGGLVLLINTSASLCLLVAVLIFTAAFIAIAQITQAASFVSYRLLSPLLRSTDHRNAYINAGWGYVLDSNPNLHIAYSWPSLYWFIPNLDYRSVGSASADGYHNAILTAPYDTHLIHKPDSRYFWLGEWLSYPWPHIESVSDRLDIGHTFEQIYDNIGSKIRMWRYHWCTSSAWWHMDDSDRDGRLSPLVLDLSKVLIDPNASEWATPNRRIRTFRLYKTGRFSPFPSQEKFDAAYAPGNWWSRSVDSVEPKKV